MNVPFKIEKPLIFFDIEATGTSPSSDRIIELALIKIMPDGKESDKRWLVNPDMPIPGESTEIHGITDEDVKDCPKFVDIADEIYREFEGCDLAGYNHARFDIPMLAAEFERANTAFSLEGVNIIDIQRIFHMHEPRDLTAALAFYCGEMHLDAHGAMADVRATMRVLEGQYKKYSDLPGTAEELDEYCNPRNPAWADREGRLKWVNGELTINFGQNKGKTVKTMLEKEPGFINWIIKKDFPADTKKILEDAKQGIWPTLSGSA